MTTDAPNKTAPKRCWGIGLTSRLPASSRLGDRISCQWQLTNNDDTTIVASFYLRTTPMRLAELTCRGGRAQRGHHHGNATVHLAANTAATISALLEPRTSGEHQLRVAVVTRNEMLERTDIIRITPGSQSN